MEEMESDTKAQKEAERIKKLEKTTEQEKKLLKSKLDSGEISQAQYDKKIAALDEKLKDEKTKSEEKLAADKKAIQKKYAGIEFAMTVAKTIANTAEAVIKAWTAGPIAGPILAVLAGAAGIVELGVANSQYQKVQSLSTGGPVIGNGTGTSDSIPANLSNGEFVVNAASAQRNFALLEAINSNRPVSFTSSTGVSDSGYTSTSTGDMKEDIISAIHTGLATAPSIKAHVVETDMTRKQREVATIESRAKF